MGWRAESQYLTVSNGYPYNNVVYSVEGDEFVVFKLQLQLVVKTSESASQSHERFFPIVSQLVQAAIPGALRTWKDLSISSDSDPLLVNGYKLTLECNDWPNKMAGGHILVFTIEVDGPPTSEGPV